MFWVTSSELLSWNKIVFNLLEQGRGSDWEGPWKDPREIYFTYKG